MGTLREKFPGVHNIETAVKVFPVAARFSAPLVAGAFVWPRVDVPTFNGNIGEKFEADGFTLAANIDALTFSRAIDPAYANGLFNLEIIRAGNRRPCTQAPFRFTAFNQGREFSANWEVTATDNQGVENFIFRLNGGLIQTPEIVALGLLQIDIIVTANVYRVKERV